MLFEPTTLTSVARIIAETLEKNYGADAGALFSKAGLDISDLSVAGARYPWDRMQILWQVCLEETGDPCFGLVAGRHIRPTSIHALGFSWLANDTLLGALNRLVRYYHVITTAPIELEIETRADDYALTVALTHPKFLAEDPSIDCFCVAVVQLCRSATDDTFAPASVALQHGDHGRMDEYVNALNAPVIFGAERDAIFFDKESLEARLPGDNLELARANDKVAEHYLESLDPRKVASEVQGLLVTLLPSGHSNQELIAQRLHRSLSTLQRQLSGEGTSYQEIREETRKTLAEEYVQDHKLSLSQIAYMLGFSDQSNFSRAFKRWTGMSPRDYRN
jgi:AraC-like DNA-binding protein